MNLITPDDFIDLYAKVIQRGLGFVLSKFSFKGIERTKSAFDPTSVSAANWWIIPEVKARWNKMITGDPGVEYEGWLVNQYFKNDRGLKMLSLGSGICSHELKFATFPQFEQVVCVDIAKNLLSQAAEKAKTFDLKNIRFLNCNIADFDFPEEEFDVVLFHSSLHHFRNIENLLSQKIKKTLKPKGKIVIHEYVGPNRLQLGKEQKKAINEALKWIEKPYRKRFKVGFYKNRFYGSGLWRMVLADPSECVESAEILPQLQKHFKTLLLRPFGGNILMHVLKDIAQHFVISDHRKTAILQKLFAFEDEYLRHHASDFVFGVFEKREE